jgi:hypothetical protein
MDEVPFGSGFNGPVPSLRVLSVSHMLMLIARRFSQKFCVFIRSHVSEATSPFMVWGCSLQSLFWWVSNGAPRRPWTHPRAARHLFRITEFCRSHYDRSSALQKSDRVKLTEGCFAFII